MSFDTVEVRDYGIPDLKSFRQVNRALYACLNASYWRELLAKHNHLTGYVLKDAIQANDPARLKFFLEQVGVDFELLAGYSSPLSVAPYLDKFLMARLVLENGAKFKRIPRTGGSAPCIPRGRQKCSWNSTPTPK
jgi:hypothetical protein